MKIKHAIRKGDVITVEYKGRVYAGQVNHAECFSLPRPDIQIHPGFDLHSVEFTSEKTGAHYWKPDIDGGTLLRVRYSRPLCPQCCDSADVKEGDNLHSYWCCTRCGWQGEVGAFVIEDVYK